MLSAVARNLQDIVIPLSAKTHRSLGTLVALHFVCAVALAQAPKLASLAKSSEIIKQSPAETTLARTPQTPLAEPVATMLDDLSYRYTGGGYHDKLIRYRLFVPVISNPPQKLPMIVWLHGLGEAGDDNVHHLRHLESCIFQKPWKRERFPFFLLAVQCPSDNPAWTTTSKKAVNMINVVLALMDKTIHDYPVDTSRISLAGISSGGSGTWDLALQAPERFSAVAPMACGGCSKNDTSRLKDIPIWSFVSLYEENLPVESARQTVAQIVAAGGRAELTGVNSPIHDCWNAAFHDYSLLDWLLYQRRGEVSDYPPGTITLKHRWRRFSEGISAFLGNLELSTWHPWQIALQLGIPALLIISYLSAKRQRRRRFAQALRQPSA